MDPISLFHMAVESITAHKLRSLLVTLGILIGVAAVLINAAMVQGFQAYFEKEIQVLGSNFVTVRPPSSIGLLGAQLEEDEYLADYLFDSLRRLPYVVDATASRVGYGTISYLGEEEDVYIVGAEPGYLNARQREVLMGDTLVPQDNYNAVVGDSLLRGAFPRPMSLQSHFDLTINVDGVDVTEEFRVKGVVKSINSPIGLSIIYLPVRTLNEMMGTEGYNEITVFADNIDHIELVEEEVRVMLDRLLRVEPTNRLAPVEEEEESAFFGLAPRMAAEGEKYNISTQSDILGVSRNITSMIQLALASIAGISLLVGGIGIANVMLVTVAERTREIGVMKAVGAKNRHVLTAFLFEAGVIGLFGGLIGLVIATTAAITLVPVLFDVPGALPLNWAGIAIGISLVISLVSGLYPAIRASRMDPVQALRSE